MKFLSIILFSIFLPINVIASDDGVIVLTKDNTLNLTDEVTSETVSGIMSKATALDSEMFGSRKPLYLFLDTPGGSITDGLKLIDFLNGLHRPTHTIVSFAASMGFQIVENLGERYILPHGVMMSHRARGQIAGEIGGQPPSQIDSRLRLWVEIVEELDRQTVSRTNHKQTLESYTKSYVSELWMTAKESIEAGYSDKIVNVRCDKSLSGTVPHNVNFMGIAIKYFTSECPLNTGISDVSAQIKTTSGLMDFTTFTQNGGAFGADCLVLSAINPNKLCSLDTSLDLEKVLRIKKDFVDTYRSNETTNRIKQTGNDF